MKVTFSVIIEILLSIFFINVDKLICNKATKALVNYAICM